MARVLFIATVFDYYPILVHALALQTVGDWELLLLHDGPNSTGLKETLLQLDDPRIRYYESEQRHQDQGRSLITMALEQVGTEGIKCDFIVVTSGSHYYCPGFVEIMCNAFDSSLIAVYCPVVHNHHHWRVIDPRLEHKRIDGGCLMVTREAALMIGWPDSEDAADWAYISQLVNRFGAHRMKRIDNVLFVHN